MNCIVGSVSKAAFAVLYQSVPQHFSPHSVHIFVHNVSGSDLSWQVEDISIGKNFTNKAIKGFNGKNLQFFANVSFTSRNSYNSAQKKYQDFIKLIEERRSQGKTEDDDDDDDIKPVELPFKLQVPYPDGTESLEKLPCNTFKGNDGSEFDIRTIDEPKITINNNIDNYNNQIKLAARLTNHKNTSPTDKYLGLVSVFDAVNLIKYNVDYIIEERMIYLHDDDIDPSEFNIIQVKLINCLSGKFLIEYEVYNARKVHIATVIQDNFIVKGVTAKM